MSATHNGKIPLSSSLSQQVSKAHIFDEIYSAFIIYLGQLCDDDFVAILDKNEINIVKDSQSIFKGRQNIIDGLWDIPITNTIIHRPHSIIIGYKRKTELIQYLHSFCFSPKPGTFLETINNGNFLTWPGLNNPIILKHLLPIIATALGNIHQE